MPQNLTFSEGWEIYLLAATLYTGTLREMWPHESALVSPLSSRYGARDTVAVLPGAVRGAWAGLGEEELCPRKIADSEEIVGLNHGVCVCLSTVLIPHCCSDMV